MQKRILSLLVLLMTAVTGAWAQEVTLLTTIESEENESFTSGSKTFDNKATVTFSGKVYNDGDEYGWYSGEGEGYTLTVTAAEGYTITRVKFYNNSGSAFDEDAPFEAIFVDTYYEGLVTEVNGTSLGDGGVTKIEVYGYAGTTATVAVTGVTLSPTSASLTVGDAVALTAAVAPDDATDKKVKWTVTAGTENVKLYKDADCNTEVGTEATDVLTVYAKGIAAGEATVKVESNADATKSATCTVTAATGAGAEETLLTTINASSDFISGSKTFDGVVTVTITGDIAYDEMTGMGWSAGYGTPGGSVSVEPAEGTTISSCKFYFDDNKTYTISTAPFVLYPTTRLSDYTIYTGPNSTGEMLYSSGGIKKIEVYGVAVPVYGVALKSGTEDATKWQGKAGTGDYQSLPLTGVEAGTAVTVKYFGTKKVESVKAVKKAAPVPDPTPATTDLSTISADYEAKDGEVLTGTLTSNVKISIADGATVTLKDVNITNLGDNCDWAGINCPGDATLVLEGTNTVCAGRDGSGYNNYPGIYIAPDKTLTIQGDGTLTAYSVASYPYGAGIGGGYDIACGNIVINSGTITATGGKNSAGIGGSNASCGNITINGGTVTATGGESGAGIGSGGSSGSCGNITISGGNITATGGESGAGIGGGENVSCGNITISGGTVEATGGELAAGIGGGCNNPVCGTITITSGVTSVTATKGPGASNSIGAGNGGTAITRNIEAGANVTQN